MSLDIQCLKAKTMFLRTHAILINAQLMEADRTEDFYHIHASNEEIQGLVKQISIKGFLIIALKQLKKRLISAMH